jgi:tetratricopeptide (TPR) repeat protein
MLARGPRPIATPGPASASSLSVGRAVAIGVLAIAALLFAFAPCLRNGFSDSDDWFNFQANEGFRGLGWAQVEWAWTTYLLGVYQPLSWLILSAEHAIWGLDPRGYHLASFLMYAINTGILLALVIEVLGRCPPDHGGGRRGDVVVPASIAVLLFAVHPLRVELVAWASCQPYLPCAAFAMLSVLAYLRAHPAGGGPRRNALLGLSALLFAASLLCKAPSTPLPAILVILDVYPLRRLGGRAGWLGPAARRVWVEKIPFVAASLAFMAVAMRVRHERLPEAAFLAWPSRLANAAFSYTFYFAKTLIPLDINPHYYFRGNRPMALTEPAVLASVVALVAVSVVLVRARGRHPGLLAAWAAYLAALAPVSGLVYAGPAFAADRYGYLASMCWLPPLAVGLGRLGRCGRIEPPALIAAALAVLAGLAVLSRAQCRIWGDRETLERHSLAHGSAESPLVHIFLGAHLQRQGRVTEALDHFEEARRLDPSDPVARGNAGACLAALGRFEEAGPLYDYAVKHRPLSAAYRFDYGRVLLALERPDEAVEQFAAAARLQPDWAEARRLLGDALARGGRDDLAAAEYGEALRLDPKSTPARAGLEKVLGRRGGGDASAPRPR